MKVSYDMRLLRGFRIIIQLYLTMAWYRVFKINCERYVYFFFAFGHINLIRPQNNAQGDIKIEKIIDNCMLIAND